MTVLPDEDLERARQAKPGDVWYSKLRPGRFCTIVRQYMTMSIVYRSQDKKKLYRDMHIRFVTKYRSTP